MKKTIKFDNMQTITVITKESPEHSVSANDAEMDKRAREAVRAAINRATTVSYTHLTLPTKRIV